MRSAAVLVTLALGACSLLVDTSDLASGPERAPPDGGSAIADTGGNVGADATTPITDAGADVIAVDASGCQGTGGPTMVAITEKACIDSTEVTRDQYAAFLAAIGTGALAGRPAACSYKATQVPKSWAAQSAGNRPVINVDWCDAWAFCKWSGKQLCGGLAGGSVAAANLNDVNGDAWYRACSANGAHAYPWGGEVFDATRCNGPGQDAGRTVDVKSLPGCQGGIPGLFDMAGNVQEWEDSCDSEATNASCSDRGGAYIHYDPSRPESLRLTCASKDTTPRNLQDNNLGIRCCKYL